MKYARTLFLLAVSLFASASAITTASAQAVISGNYYEENKTAVCNNVSACPATFSATPQNVFMTDVSCLILTTGTNPVYSVLFGVSDTAEGNLGPRRPEYFTPVPVTSNTWSVRSKAGFLFGAGRWPEIIVSTTGAVTSLAFVCKISGTFVVP